VCYNNKIYIPIAQTTRPAKKHKQFIRVRLRLALKQKSTTPSPTPYIQYWVFQSREGNGHKFHIHPAPHRFKLTAHNTRVDDVVHAIINYYVHI